MLCCELILQALELVLEGGLVLLLLLRGGFLLELDVLLMSASLLHHGVLQGGDGC